MPLTRSECAAMPDHLLVLSMNTAAIGLSRAWERGDHGSVTALYDLAMLCAEYNIREGCDYVPVHRNQLRVFDEPLPPAA